MYVKCKDYHHKYNHKRAVNIIREQVDKLRSREIDAAIIYDGRNGTVSTYGTIAITDVVHQHQEEIFTHRTLSIAGQDPVTAPWVTLPMIDPPLKDQPFAAFRTLAGIVVRADKQIKATDCVAAGRIEA